MQLLKIISKMVLLEISEKHIKTLMDKFQKEKEGLSPTTITTYIDRFEQLKNSPNIEQKDIFKLSWDELERVVDSNRKKRVKAGSLKTDKVDGDLIYNKNDIRVYRASTKEACVKYGEGYNFCISARGADSQYHYYRSDGATPYFVFFDDVPRNDPKHLLVVMHFLPSPESGINYTVTTAANNGETYFYDKEHLLERYPKFKPVVNLFKNIKPANKEKFEVEVIKTYGALEQVLHDSLREIEEELDPSSYISLLNPVIVGARKNILSGKLKTFRAKSRILRLETHTTIPSGATELEAKMKAYRAFGGGPEEIENPSYELYSKQQALDDIYILYTTNDVMKILSDPRIDALLDEVELIEEMRDSDLNKISLGLFDDLKLPKYKLKQWEL